MNQFVIENNIPLPDDSIIVDIIIDGMKICSECKIEKSLEDFCKCKFFKDGYQYKCKKCEKEYREDNKEKIKLNSKIYYKNNREKVKLKVNRYRKTEKGKRVARDAVDKYYKTEKGKESLRIASRKKRFTSKGKISGNISSRIYHSLKGNKHGMHWEDLVDYTLKELMDHLENQFESWMNWSNHGRDKGCWSIDHIKSISSFNFESYNDIEFKQCWALSNLRPLDHIENIKKSDRILG